MVALNDIHPLTGFLRDHKAHIERLEATGRPEVLTVNGRPKLVIQDARSYQRMLDAVEEAEVNAVIDSEIAAIDRGEKGVPLEQVLAEMRCVMRGTRRKGNALRGTVDAPRPARRGRRR